MAEIAKAFLKKQRFNEWIAVNHHRLTAFEMALALRLVSLFDEKRGHGYAAADTLANELGVTTRSVFSGIKKLEALGFFNIRRSTGRGNANEYTPRFDQLPHGNLFKAKVAETVKKASSFRDESRDEDAPKRVKQTSVKGEINGRKRVKKASSPPSYPSELESFRSVSSDEETAAVSAETAARPSLLERWKNRDGDPSESGALIGTPQTADVSPSGEGGRLGEGDREEATAPEGADRSSSTRKHSSLTPRQQDARMLRYIAGWIAKGLEIEALEKHLPWLKEIADTYDAGSGDKIGGQARRLHGEIEAMRP